MPPANNFRVATVQPQPQNDARKWLFKRQTEIPWNELQLNFSPQLGQSIRIRETYKVTVSSNNKTTVYANSNRFVSNTNVGFWQHLYKDFNDEYTIEREGQMNVPYSGDNAGLYTHTSSYEWEYHVYRAYKDFTGGIFGTVDACNADLEPAAVPNGFITETNVTDYVKLTAKLAGKDWIGVLQDVISLTKTTTNGFRFPDKKNLFTTLQQSLVIDLETYNIPTAIGDLGIWLNPGFEFVGCEHSIECREFGKIMKFDNQLKAVSCAYLPGFAFDFPNTPVQSCADALAEQVTAGNVFYTEQDAINFMAIPGNAQGIPSQTQFVCPDGTFYPGSVWTILSV
jgi:hypothetical protein